MRRHLAAAAAAAAVAVVAAATACDAVLPAIPDGGHVAPAPDASHRVSRDATVVADARRDAARSDAFDAFALLSPDALTEDALLGDAPSGAGDGSECHAPLSFCGGACVDEQTDPNDCGGCGALCAGACTSGRCLVTLASDQGSPAAIAVGGGRVYWTTVGSDAVASGRIMAIPVGGVPDGGAPVVVASGQGSPDGIAVSRGGAYWTTERGGTVEAVAVTDGGFVDAAPRALARGQSAPVGVAASSTGLYWANAGMSDAGGSVMALALDVDAGSPIALATAQSLPTSVALATGVLLWGTADAVMSYSLRDGGAASVVAMASPTAVATDSVYVYWTERGTAANQYADGAVVRASLSTGATTTLATGQLVGVSLAVDDESVYWTTPATPDGAGAILKVAVTGGAPTTLMSAAAPTGGIAVDGTSVYWTSSAQGGSVLTLTPK
jgi:hypothetical protein